MSSRPSEVSRREFLKAGAAVMAGSGLLGLVGCGGSDTLVPLGVDAYTLDIGYSERLVGGVRIRTRTYNGMIPGPTIETRPGRTLRVTLNNQLPPNPAPMDGENDGSGGHGHKPATRGMSPMHNPNDPHNFNTTNLHVHGLHVIPHLFAPLGTSSATSKMIAVEPGQQFTYDFKITEDHPTGLFWYHPHHHGSTSTQVFGGMAGLIVVRGAIDEVPEIKAARETVVAVQSLRVNKDKTDPDLYVMEPIAGLPPSEGGFKTNGFDRTIYTVNGEAVAWKGPDENAPNSQLGVNSVQMRPGEVMRVRFLNGTDEQLMPVQLDGHTMHVIGYDGVSLPQLQEETEVELAPGNRLEFLFKAQAPGTYTFRMNPMSGQQFESNTGFLMLNFVVSGTPVDMGLPAALPAGMQPIPDGVALPGPDLMFDTVFPYPELLTNVGFVINGKLYEEERIDHVARLNTVEEWIGRASDAEGHPLHIHVNSFQVVEVDGVRIDPPIFKDTVWIPKNSSVKIRVPYEDYVGKSVYHCHILIHEDTGMMQNFLIQ